MISLEQWYVMIGNSFFKLGGVSGELTLYKDYSVFSILVAFLGPIHHSWTRQSAHSGPFSAPENSRMRATWQTAPALLCPRSQSSIFCHPLSSVRWEMGKTQPDTAWHSSVADLTLKLDALGSSGEIQPISVNNLSKHTKAANKTVPVLSSVVISEECQGEGGERPWIVFFLGSYSSHGLVGNSM